MSLAYYIVLNNDEPGFDEFVNGKAVAHAAEVLDALCERLGLPYLDSFMGQSLIELEELLGENLHLPEGEGISEQWYEPHEGIALVDALIAHARQHPQALAEAVLNDLHEYRAVLQQALGIGAKWHLAIDM